MCIPCCWPFTDVWLEEPPKKKEEKKEDLQYIYVHDDAVWYPTYETKPVVYQPQAQYYYSAPSSAPPANVTWYGSTRAEVDTQNIVINQAHRSAKPPQLVPYKPSNEEQFYCREFDGSYTLRTCTDIMQNCQPGNWVTSNEGYPYFVRKKED